jgi:hypothetical protein
LKIRFLRLENGPNVLMGGRTLQTVCHAPIITQSVIAYVYLANLVWKMSKIRWGSFQNGGYVGVEHVPCHVTS